MLRLWEEEGVTLLLSVGEMQGVLLVAVAVLVLLVLLLLEVVCHLTCYSQQRCCLHWLRIMGLVWRC
jgi:hypothetical protein